MARILLADFFDMQNCGKQDKENTMSTLENEIQRSIEATGVQE